jgi:ribosomal protein S18 acetylase RimI-like enzyme
MIEIRKAKSDDLECIVEMQLQLARQTEALELDREVVRQGMQGVFDNPARGTYWLAVDAGRILGVLLAIPEWSDWRNATILWIHSLYIMPEARRQGVFKKLYMNLKEQVEHSPELAGIRLYVDKTNQSAQKIYEKLGMTKEHYDMYEWLK